MSELTELANRRRAVAWTLWSTAGFLLSAHVLLQVLLFVHGNDHVFGLTRLFDMDGEANLPTYFSTVLLLAASVLLTWIGVDRRRRGDRYATHWLVLAFGFFAMSIDEAAMVHGMLDAPTTSALGGEVPAALLYAWVVPYTLLVIALATYFLKFLWHLPTKTRLRFIVAGAIYVAGALGIEFLEGIAATADSEVGVVYAILNTVQETMEMAGVILFIDALLRYIVDNGSAIQMQAASLR